VLVDEVVPSEEATPEYAADRLSRAQAALESASDEEAKVVAMASLAVAETIAREIGA
jgi:F0F1-type ATP synthase epsilon subunit